MSILGDFRGILTKIDTVVEDALAHEVTDTARAAVVDALGAYSFPHSRGTAGGLSDPGSLTVTVDKVGDMATLTLTDDARGQGGADGLAVAVETGDAAWRMPGPRPFLADAQAVLDAGAARDAVRDGLGRWGLL